ncbi:MAG: Bug family tripartite tricarboxylate transporter substrate binding protein [Ramlibacter sp.]
MNRQQFLWTALGALALGATGAQAQTYPSRPVRILVGASAGGGSDILARMLGEKLSQSLKQTFVIDNKPGAANTLASGEVARANPDGYTLLLATNTGQAIAPHLMKLPFDPLKDLQPITHVATVPQVMVVSARDKAKTVGEFVSAMKADSAAYNYGSAGIGSTQHIAGETLNLAAGTHANHVPYKGSSSALVDLLSGQIQFMIDTTSSAMPHIKSGKLRALAITTPARSPQLPGVPTMAEAGFPGVSIVTWYGLYAPAGTPRPVLNRLYGEVQRVLQLPDVRDRLEQMGAQTASMTMEQFATMNSAEFESYGKVIKAAGIRSE